MRVFSSSLFLAQTFCSYTGLAQGKFFLSSPFTEWKTDLIETNMWREQSACTNYTTIQRPKISQLCMKATQRTKSQDWNRYLYTSRKIVSEIKPKEEKSPIMNQQCIVYHFQCNLLSVLSVYLLWCPLYMPTLSSMYWGTQWIYDRESYQRTTWERTKRHWTSTRFKIKILWKCQSKLDCLIFEIIYRRHKLNSLTQSAQSYLHSTEYFW